MFLFKPKPYYPKPMEQAFWTQAFKFRRKWARLRVYQQEVWGKFAAYLPGKAPRGLFVYPTRSREAGLFYNNRKNVINPVQTGFIAYVTLIFPKYVRQKHHQLGYWPRGWRNCWRFSPQWPRRYPRLVLFGNQPRQRLRFLLSLGSLAFLPWFW